VYSSVLQSSDTGHQNYHKTYVRVTPKIMPPIFFLDTTAWYAN